VQLLGLILQQNVLSLQLLLHVTELILQVQQVWLSIRIRFLCTLHLTF